MSAKFVLNEDFVPDAMPEALPQSPWGIIGQFHMAPMWRLQTNLTAEQREAYRAALNAGQLPKPDDALLPPVKPSRKNPEVEQSWCSFYYRSKANADKLAAWINENTELVTFMGKDKEGNDEERKIENKPVRVQRRVVDIETILDEDQRERTQKRAGEGSKYFGWDTFIQAPDWRSNRRYVSQMIDLPAFVAAAAKFMDYPGEFDLSPLLERVEDDRDPYTKDYEVALLGDLSQSNMDWNGVLGQQRRKLWETLGEKEFGHYELAGTVNAQGKPSKYAANPGGKLNNCLRAYWLGTKEPVWLELAEVNDPRVDAQREGTSGDGTSRMYRDKIAVVARFFDDQAAAQKVVDARTSARGEEAETEAPVNNVPDYPAEIAKTGPIYKKLQARWDKEAQAMTDEQLVEEFGVSAEELGIWRTYWNS